MKARIHQNIWGNFNGYLGTRRVKEFGTDEHGAQHWLKITETDQLYKARHRAKLDAVIARLRRVRRSPLTLSDVLNAIRAEGLPTFKTRDRMLRLGRLQFIGEHVQDQRYVIT